MGKKRRERDRPKSGPDAPYDPNKRILLSYESSDEEVEDASEQQNGSNDTPMVAVNVASHQFDEYPHEDDEAKLGATWVTADVAKEAGRSIAEGEDAEDAIGSAAKDGGSDEHHWEDEATYQRPVLGPASYENGELDLEEYDSTTEAAMAYLKGVRTERQMLPEVLRANGQVHHHANGDITADDFEGDHDQDGGYYLEDGGYVGAPASTTAVENDLADPQKVFTNALKYRFLTHRKLLHLPTTVEALATLGDGYPISFPQGNSKAYAEWHRLLSSERPNLAQLRSLEQETVFDLLALLQKHFMRRDKNIDSNVSTWIWSLLARLDDVGNMDNNQVYPLRALGKRALFLQLSFLNPEVAAQLEAVGEIGLMSTNDGDGNQKGPDLQDADRSSVARSALPRESITENTLATLDTTLVVIGEVFGQRDLLDFRHHWTVTVEPS
ncbi:hypothetical protein DOTSEDRAFT_180773 [Dothistroma septosporum NZE10]|uniref:Uncharacterized protein n=1 Tax=Dothistroma septosporum (strain NZE10 / CBS 128990) TaxID=675120 RepID=M2Y0M4_DOTSN|nr:hypothetical protein DOTSEDRAFT_180773 [Dothistroma septosporum NZE10]